MATSGSPESGASGSTPGGELAVALAVLAATAVLSGLVPARTAAAAAGATGAPTSGVTVSGADYGTTVRVRLNVTPCLAGSNTYVASLESYDSGQPLTAADRVTLKFSLPSSPTLGSSQLELRQTAPGRWEGSGLELSVVGRWRIDVVVQEAGRRRHRPAAGGRRARLRELA